MIEIFIIVVKSDMRATYGFKMWTACFPSEKKAIKSIKENNWSLDTHSVVELKIKLDTVH